MACRSTRVFGDSWLDDKYLDGSTDGQLIYSNAHLLRHSMIDLQDQFTLLLTSALLDCPAIHHCVLEDIEAMCATAESLLNTCEKTTQSLRCLTDLLLPFLEQHMDCCAGVH